MTNHRILVGSLFSCVVVLAGLFIAGMVSGGYATPGPWLEDTASPAGDGLAEPGYGDPYMYRTKQLMPHSFTLLDATNSDVALVPVDDYGYGTLLNKNKGDDFLFNFYGEDYSEIYIHGNGAVTFAHDNVDLGTKARLADPVDFGPTPDGLGVLATDLPDTMVAPFWMDLDVYKCGGDIRTNLTGATGERVFTIQWADAVATNDPRDCLYAVRHTFQVRFHEGPDFMDFVYDQALSQYMGVSNNDAVTVGIHADTANLDEPLNLHYGTGQRAALDFGAVSIRYQPNHAPHVDDLALSGLEDGYIDFYFIPTDQDGDAVTVEFDHDMLEFGSLSCEGVTCTYTPETNRFGVDYTTLTATDQWGKESEPAQVEFTVLGVNDMPFILPGEDVSVVQAEQYWEFPKDGTSWVANFNPGPFEETQGVASYVLTHNRPGFFITEPAIDAVTGTLHFTPKADSFGEVEVTMRVRDDGGTLFGGIDKSPQSKFYITVTAFHNDPPFVTTNAPLSMPQAEYRTITSDFLAADDEFGQHQITYKLTRLPGAGAVWLNSEPLEIGDTFTELDVQAGNVLYQHHGFGSEPDTFEFVLLDSHGAQSESYEFSTKIFARPNPAPAAVAIRTVSVLRGQSVALDTAHLQFRDAGGSSSVDVEYNVLAQPNFGLVMRGEKQVYKFSQFDIDAGKMYYQHDGLGLDPDTLTFFVEDLDGARSQDRVLRILVLEPNEPPTIAQPGDATRAQGETFRILLIPSDLEGHATELFIEQAPAGATIDARGVFTWLAGERHVGSHDIVVGVREVNDLTKVTFATFTLTVTGELDLSYAPKDADGDGIIDKGDNCPGEANSGQQNNDGDAMGNSCGGLQGDGLGGPIDARDNRVRDPAFPDEDWDGVLDSLDNCAFTANPEQEDRDGDGLGDACDSDRDGDGSDDLLYDNCPLLSNPEQSDVDGDGLGDACDPSDDRSTDSSQGEPNPNAQEDLPPAPVAKSNVPAIVGIILGIMVVLGGASIVVTMVLRRK